METVAVADKAVAGVDPALLADGLAVLSGQYNGVLESPRTLNAFLVIADFPAVLVLQQDLVAGDAQAGGTQLLVLGRLER